MVLKIVSRPLRDGEELKVLTFKMEVAILSSYFQLVSVTLEQNDSCDISKVESNKKNFKRKFFKTKTRKLTVNWLY